MSVRREGQQHAGGRLYCQLRDALAAFRQVDFTPTSMRHLEGFTMEVWLKRWNGHRLLLNPMPEGCGSE